MRAFGAVLACLIGLTALAVSAASAAQPGATPPGEEAASAANAELARRFYEELHTGDVTVADEIIADDAAFHMGSATMGLEETKQEAAAIKAAFPDVAWPVEDTLVDGDKVAVRWTFSGTHEGEYAGIPPSGNLVRVSGISILRIEDGEIVEGWIEFDTLALLHQLEPAPAATPPAG